KINNVNDYIAQQIYEYLKNYKNINVLAEQKDWILNWCYNVINKIDFKNSLHEFNGGSINFNRNAMITSFFVRKFDIPLPHNVLLDMLSFDYY
ncbi:MAG TPA: hypothetical protein VHZ50_11900, partial [Puia sp.]|nr:hypothetical protein [Puia sp.]